MRGRRPTPTALKIIRGNPGHHPLNRQEPVYPRLPVKCPLEILGEVAQLEWRRTIVPAIRRRQITKAERALAMAHCLLYETWLDQLAGAAKHAHVIATPNGHPIPNPLRRMVNQTLGLLVKVDAELGLTPSSRSRVKVSGKDEKVNPFLVNGRLA